MGFLDNSGDIILDAVLTDTGRYRLAKGDGSFKIAKYAFADDEIDYGKYNKDHTSGSAYYDLDILKTPVLEAFTNNTSMMKHKLMSIPRNNLLYLPVMRLHIPTADNDTNPGFKQNTTDNQANGMYLVAVDINTELTFDAHGPVVGYIDGATFGKPKSIRVDQGLQTTEIAKQFPIDPDLKETRYIVELDNRLGYITDMNGVTATPHFIDDDQIASYSFTSGGGSNYIGDLTSLAGVDDNNNMTSITGPRGTYFHFAIRSSLELETSEYLFTKLGSTILDTNFISTDGFGAPYAGYNEVLYIDTNVRITGATTGYTIDIPVRFAKVST